MTITFVEAVLSAENEAALARAIDAGLLAREALEGDGWPGASEVELRAVQRTGEEAFRRLVAANLRLVTLVTNPLARRSGLDADDLFQEGVLGLLEAARRYDPGRGARFATFALPWIRMKVGERTATRFGELGLPPARAKRWVQVRAVEDLLRGDLGRAPTVAELARASGMAAPQVDDLLAFRPPVGLCVEELLADRAAPADGPEVDMVGLVRLLRSLPGDESAVLVRLFGLAPHPVMSYTEVAAALAMSVSTVRRRERAGLQRLRGLVDEDLAA